MFIIRWSHVRTHLGAGGTLETQHPALVCPDPPDGQLGGQGGEGVSPGHRVLAPRGGAQEDQAWEYAQS